MNADSRFPFRPMSLARRPCPGRPGWMLGAVLVLLYAPVHADAPGPAWLDPEGVSEVRGFSILEGFERVPGLVPTERSTLSPGRGTTHRGVGAPDVRVDGVPMQLADGRWAGESLDVGSLGRMGPLEPALAPGGSTRRLEFTSQLLRDPEPRLRGGVVFGGDRERAQRIAGQQQEGRWESAVQASNVEWGGYRDHQDRADRRLSFQVDRALDDRERVRLIGRAIERPNAQDPGTLNADELRADRQAAGAQQEAFDAGQDLSEQLLAVHWETDPTAGERHEVRARLRRRTEERFLGREPAGVQEIRTHEVGLEAETHVRGAWRGAPLDIRFGLEGAWQEEETDEFENQQGVAGARDGEWRAHARTAGAGARFDWSAAPDWRTHGAVRLDRTQLRTADEFGPAGSERANWTEGTWMFGAAFDVLPRQTLVTRISSGYRTPTLAQAIRTEGLAAERHRTVEAGLQGALAGDRGHWHLMAFDTRVDDLILPVPTDRTAEPPRSRNVEESRFRGVELGLQRPLSPATRVSLSVTGLRATLEESGAQEGNPVPGIPSATGHMAFQWQTPTPWRVSLDARGGGSASIDDADSERSGSWLEAGLRLSRRHEHSGWRGRSFIAVVNVTDEAYETVTRVNDAGGRAFEPAPERTFLAGITLETP